MKNIVIASAFFFGLVSFASAQGNIPTYAQAKECLEKICVEVDGKKGCLTEGSHFRQSRQKKSNDPFTVAQRINVVAYPDGLWIHPIWKDKKGEINKCVPGSDLQPAAND